MTEQTFTPVTTDTDASVTEQTFTPVTTDTDASVTEQTFTPVTTDTDAPVTEQTVMETTPALEIPKPYSDELWRSTSIAGHPWLEPIKDRQEIVGEEFKIRYTFMTEDYNYSSEKYDFEFAVSDPTVAEVIGASINEVCLKGLKPGEIWVEMKMIHKETGGVYCTYVGLTIVPVTLQPGTFPEECKIRFYKGTNGVQVGQISEQTLIEFHVSSEKYANKNDYSVEATVDDPSILQVVEINKDKLMDDHFDGGIVVKGMGQGTARLTLTTTYLPTGGVCSVYTDITVYPPYEILQDEEKYIALCVGEPRTIIDMDVCDGVELEEYMAKVSVGYTYEYLVQLTTVAFELDVGQTDPKENCTVEVTAKETDLVEIVSVNENRLKYGWSNGVTLKTLAAGTAHLYITFTNIQTGESSTIQMVLIINEATADTTE